MISPNEEMISPSEDMISLNDSGETHDLDEAHSNDRHPSGLKDVLCFSRLTLLMFIVHRT